MALLRQFLAETEMPASDLIQSNRRFAAMSLAVVVGAFATIYFDTLSSIVATWWAVNAYHHGFLILPICIFLMWRQRQAIHTVSVSPSWAGVTLLGVLSLVWWLSDFAGIQVLKQFSIVAMVPASVAAIYGWSTVKVFRFPLLYLLLAVPFGEFLLPQMVDFTAGFAVDVLSLLQIPVFRDGRYFHIPTGSFEVAEACGGLKYFISTFALAVLYSHFLFANTSKKLLFVAVALLLSIVTNAIRATVVVLLLHYTDLDIARGKDHEFVGWILFGLMIAILLWLGNTFADKHGETDAATRSRPDSLLTGASAGRTGFAVAASVAVAALSIGATLGVATEPTGMTGEFRGSGLPAQVENWSVDLPEDAAWLPSYSGYTQMVVGHYQNNGNSIDVALVQYATLRQGAEITSATNSVANLAEWRLGNVIQVADGRWGPIISEVKGNAAHEARLFWYWTDVNGTSFDGKFKTKTAEIRNMLSGIPNVSSAVILSTRILRSEEDSQRLLHQFATPFYEQLRACMAGVATRHACFLSEPAPKDT